MHILTPTKLKLAATTTLAAIVIMAAEREDPGHYERYRTPDKGEGHEEDSVVMPEHRRPRQLRRPPVAATPGPDRR